MSTKQTKRLTSENSTMEQRFQKDKWSPARRAMDELKPGEAMIQPLMKDTSSMVRTMNNAYNGSKVWSYTLDKVNRHHVISRDK